MERVDAALHDWSSGPVRHQGRGRRQLRPPARARAAPGARRRAADRGREPPPAPRGAGRRAGRGPRGRAADGRRDAPGNGPGAGRRGGGRPADREESLVLYTPVVHAEDFDAAVALPRPPARGERRRTENYLYAMFSEAGPASYVDRFRASVRDHDLVADTPRRTQDRSAETSGTTRSCHPASGNRRSSTDAEFRNEPDTDPSLPANRGVGPARGRRHARRRRRTRADRPGRGRRPSSAGPRRRRGATPRRPDRAHLLREAAACPGRRAHRAADDDGRTRRARPSPRPTRRSPRRSTSRPTTPTGPPRSTRRRFTPDRVVVVTPPWNFPVAIPLGGCLAALAAGAAVVIKPAPQVRACAEVGVAALHRAGIPADVLQLVHTDEGAAGRRLITHPAVDAGRAHRRERDGRAVPVVAARPAR